MFVEVGWRHQGVLDGIMYIVNDVKATWYDKMRAGMAARQIWAPALMSQQLI